MVTQLTTCLGLAALAAYATAAGRKTIHECTCKDAGDCKTNSFYQGLQWCHTEPGCKHNYLSHNWDYCEERDAVENGRDMCDVWRERSWHSACSTPRSGPGNIVIELLVAVMGSCTVRCNDTLWMVGMCISVPVGVITLLWWWTSAKQKRH